MIMRFFLLFLVFVIQVNAGNLWTRFDYTVSVRFIPLSDNGNAPMPNLLHMPSYPFPLMRAAVSGDVVSTISIMSDGSVNIVDVKCILMDDVDSDIKDMFSVEVENVLLRWVFPSEQFDGENFDSKERYMKCQFSFRVNEPTDQP